MGDNASELPCAELMGRLLEKVKESHYEIDFTPLDRTCNDAWIRDCNCAGSKRSASWGSRSCKPSDPSDPSGSKRGKRSVPGKYANSCPAICSVGVIFG